MPHEPGDEALLGIVDNMKPEGRIESIRTRLLNRSRSRGESFDFVLSRYGVERFLHRLARSQHADRFVLKGATLFHLWNHELHRPTRDLDLLGSGPADLASLRSALLAILRIECPEDGLVFDDRSLTVGPIRDDQEYGGVRAKFRALFGTARILIQVDVGFGDAVTPDPETLDFPLLLPEMPGIRLKSYPVATVIAEKFEALVRLDAQNSRMKDFFDLDFLLRGEVPDRCQLTGAIEATFRRRKTTLPDAEPAGLSAAFVEEKSIMWGAFLLKNGLEKRDFGDVVKGIRNGLKWIWKG